MAEYILKIKDGMARGSVIIRLEKVSGGVDPEYVDEEGHTPAQVIVLAIKQFLNDKLGNKEDLVSLCSGPGGSDPLDLVKNYIKQQDIKAEDLLEMEKIVERIVNAREVSDGNTLEAVQKVVLEIAESDDEVQKEAFIRVLEIIGELMPHKAAQEHDTGLYVSPRRGTDL